VLPVSGPVNRRHLPNLSSITARACSDCSESHRCSPIIIVTTCGATDCCLSTLLISGTMHQTVLDCQN
jgi:hypothetical protein